MAEFYVGPSYQTWRDRVRNWIFRKLGLLKAAAGGTVSASEEWMLRWRYDDSAEGPLVALTDFNGVFGAYVLPGDADRVCERYNRGFPEPPEDGSED
jgi:hypothetical protein